MLVGLSVGRVPWPVGWSLFRTVALLGQPQRRCWSLVRTLSLPCLWTGVQSQPREPCLSRVAARRWSWSPWGVLRVEAPTVRVAWRR